MCGFPRGGGEFGRTRKYRSEGNKSRPEETGFGFLEKMSCVSFSNCAQCLPRSGNADCEGFHGMFCGETAGTSPTPKKYPDGEYVANEWKTIIVIIVLLVVLFLFWLFNNRLTRLRTTIRRGTARVVLYVWREARGLWTRTRRRFSGGRVEPSQDWRVRYNEGAGTIGTRSLGPTRLAPRRNKRVRDRERDK
ncbi:unnamed protein product [Allacma fusca]|uniref:Uncharacterized protein n=1 Tax=Allacma fusca TaxID=39272 RepID=A0A8J2KM55_9HEXA|nr:unnamed protein product [Allacma fusca]